MKKRRNRKKQETSLEQRLASFSERWRKQAEADQNEDARNVWQQRARSTEAALGIIEWLAAREERR